MHIIKWKGLNGSTIIRKYLTLNQANEMASWLRSQNISFTHTFEE